MRRSVGLFLLALGVFVTVAGLLGCILVNNDPTPTIESLLTAFIVVIAGLALLIVGNEVFPRAGPRVPETREIAGCRVEILYVGKKMCFPSRLRLRIPVTAPTTLQFNRETWFDRFCKGIGVAREHQTGDDAFDAAIYIRGPSFGYAGQYLESRSRRAAILGLLDKGFSQVRLTGAHIVAEGTGFNPPTDEFIEETASELITLADEVPADDPDLASARTDWRMIWVCVLMVLVLGYVFTFFFVFDYPPIRKWDLILKGLLLFALAFPLYVVIAGILLRGASTSHDHYWPPAVFAGFVMLGLGSAGPVAAVNGVGDDSPTVEREAIVIEKKAAIERNRARTYETYHATVADWDRPGETIEFCVSLHDYHAIVPNRSHLVLTTSRGRLGIEWLKSLRVQ